MRESASRYKYRIVTTSGAVLDKSDPFAFATEEPPRTASVITNLDYEWGDGDWMAQRAARNRFDAPISMYEVHLGSWRYEPGGYRALAVQLADYLERTGFTHVELMPVMEHPFYGSWGYQTTGYFAPTARYGTPQDLMFLIDHLHERGFGVVLDWVPSHFPTDAFGLAEFDGTHLYEHADPRLGFHPDWKSAIFNYDRHEVRSFLLSSARFWLERYHADAIRVDAVASMLYRDYSRQAGEWIPNQHGGRENLGAIAFLQEFNRRVYLHHPDTFTVAEESTAWPGVTHPTDGGGLGFGFKWDMGWMNDTLEYFRRDPVHRRWHLGELTFRTVYAFNESFVLPLSHDEVVHGKGSLLSRQPGDRWHQFAGLRLLFGYQYGQPGKKLMFMGSELGMPDEWNHERELPWGLLQYPEHSAILDWVSALNQLYHDEPALHRGDNSADGFRWVVGNDDANSVLAFVRLATGLPPGAGGVQLHRRTPYRLPDRSSRRGWLVDAAQRRRPTVRREWHGERSRRDRRCGGARPRRLAGDRRPAARGMFPRADMSADGDLSAGDFSSWMIEIQGAIRGDHGSDVPCGGCTACCTSSQFIHVGPDESDSLAHIPTDLLFPAPGLPAGHVVLGYDERGHCPMLIDDKCSIYEHRPRTCRTYDCRVFPAAGLDLEDPDKVLIAERAQRWRFSYRHRGRPSAARRCSSGRNVPPRVRPAVYLIDAVPANTTQLAVRRDRSR